MLGQLPKLLDRNFIIGYFLPVVVFLAVAIGLMSAFGLASSSSSSSLLSTLTTLNQPLVGTTLVLLVSWLLAVLLLLLNRTLYGLLEGYGSYNPAQIFKGREESRHQALLEEKEAIEKEFWNADEVRQRKLQARYDAINLTLSEQFPWDSNDLLPTRLGNTIRAFETYPSLVYGLDAIEGYSRLVAVIPKDYLKQSEDAKAQTDFWVNIWAISSLTLVGCIGLIVYSSVTNRQWSLLLLLPAAVVVYVLLALLAVRRARVAAVEWGSFVKAQFDTFLPALGKSLELPATATRKKQRELWQLYSNVITYRSEDDLRKLDDEIDRLTGKSPPRQELPDVSPQGKLPDGTTEDLNIAFVAIPKDGLIGRTLRAIFLSSSQN